MTGSLLRRPWLPALLIVAAVILAYWNSLGTPFLFDDIIAVSSNPTIRQLDTALAPPNNGGTTTGRPLLNFSLALNHAIHGEEVWGYHATNILIHAAVALCLFGLLRRTLECVPCRSLLAGDASSRSPASRLLPTEVLAFVVALLWALHPLQTESVTCVAQRSESLCGLWYLLTLYGLARGAAKVGGALRPDRNADTPSGHKAPPTKTEASHWRWLVLSGLACLAGMASKEVMVTAPLVAFLYDRTFLAGSFAGAWRQRRGYYLALAASLLLLGALVLGGGGTRGTSAGFGLGITPWTYLLTQCEALVLYLRLALWPHPLIVDYGTSFVDSWHEVWWQGLVVLGLLAGTGWALVRRPVLGFLGAWFFVILAPSSSLVPLVSQPIAEHRMYLPLAAVLVWLAGAAAARLKSRTFLAAGLLLAMAAGASTVLRNREYQDERAMWEEVLTRRPLNARVLSNLGRVEYQQGRLAMAATDFRLSLRLQPGNPFVHFNLGLALMQTGHDAEAAPFFAEAVRLRPDFFYAHGNLAVVLTRLNREPEALPHFALALRLDPAPANIHFQWGVALAGLGRWADAAAHYAESLRLNPHQARALSNWGTALFHLNDFPAAADRFMASLRLASDQPEVHFNLAQALSALGRRDDAMTHYAEAVRLKPGHAAARLNLGIALAQAGRLPEAISQLEESVRLQPDAPEGHANLGVALALAGRPADALAAYQAARRLRPDDAQANYNVGFALLEAGRWTEARPYFETAVRLRPNFPAAQEILLRLQEMAPR